MYKRYLAITGYSPIAVIQSLYMDIAMQCNIVQQSGTLYIIQGITSSKYYIFSVWIQVFQYAAVLCDSVSNSETHSLMQ